VSTDLIEVDSAAPSSTALARAGSIIRSGGVVAIPTDALYTLVADPFNLQAVQRVFQAKGRESSRSLPLLVSDLMMAEELSTDLSSRFYMLARKFWPGPLAIIMPASARIPLKVTGNTGRLAMRHAKSEVASGLLEWLGQPLIGTSANISGKPTCTTGIDAFATLDGKIDLVLDGGLCSGGGATTVDITEPWWKLIKEGLIPEKEIAECLKGV